MMWCVILLLFFFFQAEDGIRDIGVTGVQTCALPISGITADRIDVGDNWVGVRAAAENYGQTANAKIQIDGIDVADSTSRSEERRVGKECRSRWSPYH